MGTLSPHDATVKHHTRKHHSLPNPMKTTFLRLIASTALLTASAGAQTINWGSVVFSDLRDSNGVTLDDGFLFEIGAFDPGLDPSVQPLSTNLNSWLQHWNVFDRVTGPAANGYNAAAGYFTGATAMTDDGLSTSMWLDADIPSFEGLDAYLWIRKGDSPVPGSEWLLVRASDWVFPTAIPGCCDNGLPIEWSVSDLNSSNVPQWGRQGDTQGPGVYTVTDTYTLQTYTFPVIPETSSALLVAVGILGAALRRRK